MLYLTFTGRTRIPDRWSWEHQTVWIWTRDGKNQDGPKAYHVEKVDPRIKHGSLGVEFDRYVADIGNDVYVEFCDCHPTKIECIQAETNRLIKIKEDDKKRGIGDDGYYRYTVSSTKSINDIKNWRDK